MNDFLQAMAALAVIFACGLAEILIFTHQTGLPVSEVLPFLK